jgi:SAM-dependent methyltransferase
MNLSLTHLRDPFTGSAFIPQDDNLKIVFHDGNEYPITRNIPRFVEGANYADAFGWQWNKFKSTQLDSSTGVLASFNRLSRCMNGHLDMICGKKILEAGSGAGRFTEVLLAKGAIVDSFDYSSAVEANRDNNGNSDNLVLVQADVRHMPFPKAAYDYVIGLGMIQHTPDSEETIAHLYSMIRPGGFMVIDHYIFKWIKLIPPPFGPPQEFYRRIILMLPKHWRYPVVESIVNFFFPVQWFFRFSSLAKRIIARFSPVCFYHNRFGIADKKTLYEWALLDTHDGTTDFYRHLRTARQIHSCLSALGAVEIKICEAGNGVEAICRKPPL